MVINYLPLFLHSIYSFCKSDKPLRAQLELFVFCGENTGHHKPKDCYHSSSRSAFKFSRPAYESDEDNRSYRTQWCFLLINVLKVFKFSFSVNKAEAPAVNMGHHGKVQFDSRSAVFPLQLCIKYVLISSKVGIKLRASIWVHLHHFQLCCLTEDVCDPGAHQYRSVLQSRAHYFKLYFWDFTQFYFMTTNG